MLFRSSVRSQGTVEFATTSKSNVEYEVPLIYYKGYRAILTDNTGATQELDVRESAHGLVEVLDEKGLDGNVNVCYQETAIQKISKWISILTVLGVSIVQVAKRKRKYKKE